MEIKKLRKALLFSVAFLTMLSCFSGLIFFSAINLPEAEAAVAYKLISYHGTTNQGNGTTLPSVNGHVTERRAITGHAYVAAIFGTHGWVNASGGSFNNVDYRKAFDGNDLLTNTGTYFDGYFGGHCGVEFHAPQIVSQIVYRARSGYENRLDGAVLEGSNDGTAYTPLLTLSGASATLNVTKNIDNSSLIAKTPYKYYRVMGTTYGDMFNPQEIWLFTFADGTDPFEVLTVSDSMKNGDALMTSVIGKGIIWSVDKADMLNANTIVARPFTTDLVLTASIDGVSRQYPVTVTGILDGINISDSITNGSVLPDKSFGVDIVWSSSDPSVLVAGKTIKAKAFNAPVNLTATFNGQTKLFPVTVVGILDGIILPDPIPSGYILPALSFGEAITWKCDPPSLIVGGVFSVSKPSKATLTVKFGNDTKVFNDVLIDTSDYVPYDLSAYIVDNTVSAKLKNNTREPISAMLIMAAYDTNKRLVLTRKTEVNVPAGSGGANPISWDASPFDAENYTFKVFAWHTNYAPITEAVLAGDPVAEVIDLAGEWEFKLGAYAAGDSERTLNDTVKLPGTLDENSKGTLNTAVSTTTLSRKYTYTGSALFQKKVFIPADWADKSVTLLMERTKMTVVRVNGVTQNAINANNAFGVAQLYNLTGLVPDADNVITIQVSNTGYPSGISTGSHMFTDNSVTNWNGITGRIELQARPPVYVKNARIYPNIKDNTAVIKFDLRKDVQEAVSGNLTINAESYNHDGAPAVVPAAVAPFSLAAGIGETTVEYVYNMGSGVKLWSEFHPALYKVKVRLTAGSGNFTDDYETSFGMREFGARGKQFTINNKVTFMRGECSQAVFPLTGYCYMTKDEWIDYLKKAQNLGLNFFRFHSWTPPEEAFAAADELGMYFQPELYSFDGTLTGALHAYNKTEAERILKTYANHPSFVMFAWGNELNTSTTARRATADDMREYCKTIDRTRLYAEGSNNNYSNVSFNTADDYWTTCKTVGNTDPYHIRISFAHVDAASMGILESTQPNSVFTYTFALTARPEFTKPIMNHEVGQFQTLPWYENELPKYTGLLEPRNLIAFRNTMEEKGLLEMNEKLSRASAASGNLQYRAELETSMRTPNFGGYQLLSMQDFPGQSTAHCGMLDVFMDEKPGGMTYEQFKSVSKPVTAFAKIPKYFYSASEPFSAEVVLTNYSEDDLVGVAGSWAIKRTNGTVFTSGNFSPVTVPQGTVTTVGEISLASPFSRITKADRFILEVSASGSANTYNIWVYPLGETAVPSNVLVATEYTNEVRQTLATGGRVLLLAKPNRTDLPNSVAVRWTNDYWSMMFHGDPITREHTLGMYVDTEHPVFDDFPTEFFGDYNWKNLMKQSRAIVLDNAPRGLTPMAQNIDHFRWSKRLGSLFEAKVGAGSLLVCTFDLLGYKDIHPEVKQMYNSIMQYVGSSKFNPTVSLTNDYLATILRSVTSGGSVVSAYSMISASNYFWKSDNDINNTQSGTDEGGNPITGAVGGFTNGRSLIYKDISFGTGGTQKIVISGSNSAAANVGIEMRIGSTSGPVIKTLNFAGTGGANNYRRQTFDIPRITGTQDIVFTALGDTFRFDGFYFIRDDVQYINPYVSINRSQLNPNDITDVGGDGYWEWEQQTIYDIRNQIRLTFRNVDFGFEGASRITIGGHTPNATVQMQLLYKEDGVEKSIPITFRNGVGTKYSVEGYITTGLDFYQQTIELPSTIKGIQDLSIQFASGSRFTFHTLMFT